MNSIEQKTYSIYVSQLIRKKYSLDAELAIIRQRDSKPDEFAEYNTYCESCKAKAKVMQMKGEDLLKIISLQIKKKQNA